MSPSEETRKLRNRADECRALAQKANDDEVRFSYLSLAEAYETLAKQQQTSYVRKILGELHRQDGRRTGCS